MSMIFSDSNKEDDWDRPIGGFHHEILNPIQMKPGEDVRGHASSNVSKIPVRNIIDRNKTLEKKVEELEKRIIKLENIIKKENLFGEESDDFWENLKK